MAQTLFPLVVLSCLAGISAQPGGVQLHGEAKDAVEQRTAWSQLDKNQSIGNRQTNRLEMVLAGTRAQQKGMPLRRKARDAVERRAARSQAIDNHKTNQHPLLDKLFAELDQLPPYTHADALEPSPRLVAALAAERAGKGRQLRPHQFGFATAEPTFPLPPFYTAMRDDKPRILGLENCAAYRATVPLDKRMPGVEGAFNTGTNVMVRERCTEPTMCI